MPAAQLCVAEPAGVAVKWATAASVGGVIMFFVSPQARRLFLAIVLLVGPTATAAAQDRAGTGEGERTYRVVAVHPDDVLNIRAGPSAGHPIVGEIPPTARGVQLLGPCRGWCPVRYNGASGWVSGRYLAIEPAVAPFVHRLPPGEPLRKLPPLPAHWRVTGVAPADGLRVHEEPSLQAPVVHVFEPTAACISLGAGCQKPWCQVKFPTGSGDRVGWVDSKYLVPADGPCGR
jgi:uncharacterized protein YraI